MVTDASVTVHVTLHGDVRRLRPKSDQDRFTVQTPGGTINDLLDVLGARQYEQLIIAINNEIAPPDTLLHDGDDVLLSTPMEGG